MDEEAIANAMADAYISAMNDVDAAIDNDTIDELVNSSMVIINGFQFCKDHGNETCTPCEGDCRLNNNDALPKSLYNRLKRTVWAGISPLSRPPINNIYKKYKPIPTGELHPTRRYEFYACHDHHEIDCNVCFDWMEVLEGKIKKEEPTIDRRVILGLLKAMGVELPPDTKMRDEVLEKKFSAALTASQSLSSYGASSISPEKLPQWTGSGKTSAFEAMNRASVTETLRAEESKRAGTADPFPLYENAFMDARQTSRHLARNYEQGHKALVLRDKDNAQAICIRMLGVYKLNKDTPLISLIYETVTYSNPDEIANALEFMYHLGRYGRGAQIHATIEELALFRQLLAENSRRVSAKYRPPKESYEKTFQPSFVVPIGPLSQIDIGKLTHNTGCEICGNKSTSRCSQCQSASYCGPACQKIHWPEHKTMCRSLKGGEWVTIQMHTHVRLNGVVMQNVHVSNHGLPVESVDASDGMQMPPNVHGDQPFLVKLQRPLSDEEMPMPGLSSSSGNGKGPQSMFVYDRQRSFRAHVWDVNNRGVYERVIKEILAGKNKNKMYRWAKRIGPNDLSVCLDREPVPPPTW